MTEIQPPPPLSETRARIYSAINTMGSEKSMQTLSLLGAEMPRWFRAHLEMEHSIPSPSGIERCRLEQYFKAKLLDPDQSTPLNWKVRRAMGVLAEPYWLTVLSLSGFEIDLPNETFSCGPHMIAHPDAVLDTNFLVELKSISGWGYRKLIESVNGVFGVEKGHFTQAQMYMYAADKEWCLYLSFPADAGLLQSIMRQKKKYGKHYELEPVYFEWIHRDDGAIRAALDRANTIVQDIASETPPMREFKGFEYDIDGSRAYPCGYCLFLGACHGVTETQEESIHFER